MKEEYIGETCMILPNLIIAGTPKAGTTSVFRYMGNHPDVCASSIKEIQLFLRYRGKIDTQAILQYESYFRHSGPKHSIRLEASPRYLIGGRRIAEDIRRHLPEVKLIFILREPVSRFFSRYISLRSKTNRAPSSMPLDKLVNIALKDKQVATNDAGEEYQEEILEYLWEGSYALFLEQYLQIFSNKNICILFFDELSQRPREFMTKICNFAGIDHNFYNDYIFSIENKTRTVKYRKFHKFSENLNRKIELYLNRHTLLRNCIRKVYYEMLNPEVDERNKIVTDYAKNCLERYYAPLNDKLHLLLQKEYPKLTVPDWVIN